MLNFGGLRRTDIGQVELQADPWVSCLATKQQSQGYTLVNKHKNSFDAPFEDVLHIGWTCLLYSNDRGKLDDPSSNPYILWLYGIFKPGVIPLCTHVGGIKQYTCNFEECFGW